MRIYLDLVVILNFFVDFLLLLGTNRLSGFPASPLRAAAAAALGALYSGVCMMPRLRFLGGLLWRVVSLAGMAAIAFGWDKSAWKRSGVFVLLSMALGGASLSIGRGNFLTLLLTAGGVWALCIVAFGGRVGGREYVPVAEKLTGLTQDQLRAPLKTLMCRPVPGLRLIPYRAVGQAGDMLLAMRFDRVKIGNRTQSAVVAFAAEGLGRGDAYQALTGGVI